MTGRQISLWFWLTMSAALQAAQQQDHAKINVRVDLVSIDVEVLDRQGTPVPTLDKGAFIVKESGKPVEVTNFSRLKDRSVSLAFVLDTSAIPQPKLVVAKRFISLLAHLISREDEIALYSFDGKNAYCEVDFTRDRAPLQDALDNIDVPSHRGGRPQDLFGGMPQTAMGIDLALLKAATGTNEKKAVLIISDRFKGLGPVTVDHVQKSGCTLYTLGFANKASAILTLWGDQISKNELMKLSGGRRFSADTEEITGVCRSIAYSLKNHYTLGFLTDLREPEKKRKIEITVPGHDYTINFRRTYTVPQAKQ